MWITAHELKSITFPQTQSFFYFKNNMQAFK